MTALEMALEVRRTIDYLTAVKERPRSEVAAERKLAKRLQEVFHSAAASALAKLEDAGVVPSNEMARRAMLQAFEDAVPELAAITQQDAVEAAQRGRNKAIDTLRKQGATGLSFDQLPKGMIERIQQSTFQASERTMRRLVGDIRGALEQGYQDGLGIDGFRELLEGKFQSMEQFELNRIARTEVQSLQNVGTFETMRDLGVAYQEWVSAGDDRVRESHLAVDGEIVEVGTRFSNDLRFPLDTDGPEEEWINCRCRAVPFIVPSNKIAPGSGPFYESDLINKE